MKRSLVLQCWMYGDGLFGARLRGTQRRWRSAMIWNSTPQAIPPVRSSCDALQMTQRLDAGRRVATLRNAFGSVEINNTWRRLVEARAQVSYRSGAAQR